MTWLRRTWENDSSWQRESWSHSSKGTKRSKLPMTSSESRLPKITPMPRLRMEVWVIASTAETSKETSSKQKIKNQILWRKSMPWSSSYRMQWNQKKKKTVGVKRTRNSWWCALIFPKPSLSVTSKTTWRFATNWIPYLNNNNYSSAHLNPRTPRRNQLLISQTSWDKKLIYVRLRLHSKSKRWFYSKKRWSSSKRSSRLRRSYLWKIIEWVRCG